MKKLAETIGRMSMFKKTCYQLYHKVDNVIESKNFVLINLSLNVCETIYDNKVFLENSAAVLYMKLLRIF